MSSVKTAHVNESPKISEILILCLHRGLVRYNQNTCQKSGLDSSSVAEIHPIAEGYCKA